MSELEQQATELRKQGLSYKEISTTLDGALSIDWCKKNLKSIPKGEKQDPCMQELITLAQRPQGLQEYEAVGIMFKHNEHVTQNQINYMKDKVRKTPHCLLHKGWIDTMQPEQSHKSLNAFALHLMDSVDQMVDEYLDMYPNTNRWSVRNELLQLSFSDKINGGPLSHRIARNELLAETLSNRNTE